MCVTCNFAALRVHDALPSLPLMLWLVQGEGLWAGLVEVSVQPAPKRVVCFRLPRNALDTLGWRRAGSVLKEQRVKQRRQFLEEVRLSELRQYRW